jgi:hypothetical protein
MPNVVEFPQRIERGCGLDVHQQTKKIFYATGNCFFTGFFG